MNPVRFALAMTLGTGLLGFGPPADADVRIVAADGRFAPEGTVRRVLVRPGQVVSFSADEVFVDASGRIEYARRPPEDFAWQADSPPDRCDPAVGCPADSRFEATPYGVNYYVPWEPPARIRIRASLKGGTASDVVELVQEESVGTTDRPAWEREIEGLGYWVRVGDLRVFVPVVYVAGWSPYRHGYWYWTRFGWTWYSYDPWGAITDHCGHWRHHRFYGWVWVPEPVCVWRPAVVTFFFGPLWIGWYPYDPSWPWGYWYGYEHGFDDGYWLGYAVGRAAGDGEANPGFVATTYEDFYPHDHDGTGPAGEESSHAPRGPGQTASGPARDLTAIRFADPVTTNKAFNEALRKGHVGPIPGGGSRPSDAWKFWAHKTKVRPREVPLKPVSPRPGLDRWFEPVDPPARVPDEYRKAADRIRTSTGALAGGRQPRRVGVGQALDAADASAQRPVMGVAVPPVEASTAPSDPAQRPPRGTTPSKPVWKGRVDNGSGEVPSAARWAPEEGPAQPGSPFERPTVRPPQRVPREYRVKPARPPVSPEQGQKAQVPPERVRAPVVSPRPRSEPAPSPARVRESPPPSSTDHARTPEREEVPSTRLMRRPVVPSPASTATPAGTRTRPVVRPPAARPLPFPRTMVPAVPNTRLERR